ncbi:MAG: class I SAM-dependent methyltransferase [Candidatus Kerfeldbacteria bacterium]|nr:class I SAM-dependent methyltransferase [Candidatus Kerfeldbacteria bacterium]
MNSITLIRDLLDQQNTREADTYLQRVWNQVWTEQGQTNYASLRLFKTADKIQTISRMGVDFRSKKVLDIGCGNGATLMYLRKFFEITGAGVDISDSVVQELRQNIVDGKLSFFLGDHRDLQKLEPNQFDIVLSFGVIEHFEAYGLALAEARRMLTAEGHIVLIQPHLLSFGVCQEFYLRLFRKWKFGNQKDFAYWRYRSLLRQAGFRDVRYMTKPPYPDMKVTRMLDGVMKRFIPCWGHYLYLIAKK